MKKHSWRIFWLSYRRPIIVWSLIVIFIVLGVIIGVQGRVIAIADTQKICDKYNLDIDPIALVKNLGVGKMQMTEIAKALSIPLLWLMNALGYFSTVVLVRRGYSKDVLNTRVVTITLIVGMVIGYILGKLV